MKYSLLRPILWTATLFALPSISRAQCELLKVLGSPGQQLAFDVDVNGDRILASTSNSGPAGQYGQVYRRVGDSWSFESNLVSGGLPQNAAFAPSVALGDDDAFVGVQGSGSSGAGVAWFRRFGNSWTEQSQGLIPSPSNLNIGFARALSFDGTTLAIGSPGEPNIPMPGDPPISGTVRLYQLDTTGTLWNQVAMVSNPGTSSGAGAFGQSLAISGTTLVVGSELESAVGGGGSTQSLAGAAFVFEFDPVTGGWPLEQELYGENANDFFGSSVDLDGDQMIIGSPFEDTAVINEGAARVYSFCGSCPVGQRWQEQQLLVSGLVFPEVGKFGSSVGLSGDYALVGASPLGAPHSVFVFHEEGGTWSQRIQIQDGSSSPLKGAVAIDGPNLAVGTTTNGDGQLAAYSYDVAGLCGSPGAISVQTGGQHLMSIDAGPSFANEPYLVVATVSGTSPGFFLGSVHVPINTDELFDFSLGGNNSPPWVQNLGFLDSDGRATATFSVPSGSSASLIGLTVNHSCLLSSGGVVVQATAPIGLLLTP